MNSNQSKPELAKTHHEDRARDDLKGAVAGDQNRRGSDHANHLKERKINKDSGREPIV